MARRQIANRNPSIERSDYHLIFITSQNYIRFFPTDSMGYGAVIGPAAVSRCDTRPCARLAVRMRAGRPISVARRWIASRRRFSGGRQDEDRAGLVGLSCEAMDEGGRVRSGVAASVRYLLPMGEQLQRCLNGAIKNPFTKNPLPPTVARNGLLRLAGGLCWSGRLLYVSIVAAGSTGSMPISPVYERGFLY